VPKDVTEELHAWMKGDAGAPERFMPAVYDELRHLAGRALRRERPNHTLQATALVHEAYLRLVDQRNADWRSRSHFCVMAAEMMRRILVDHARGRLRAKRGAGAVHVTLDVSTALAKEEGMDVIAVDEAIRALAEFDPRQSRIVELRFFAGLSNEEIGEALGVSVATVKREWTMAKAWLYRRLSGGAAPAADH